MQPFCLIRKLGKVVGAAAPVKTNEGYQSGIATLQSTFDTMAEIFSFCIQPSDLL